MYKLWQNNHSWSSLSGFDRWESGDQNSIRDRPSDLDRIVGETDFGKFDLLPWLSNLVPILNVDGEFGPKRFSTDR